MPVSAQPLKSVLSTEWPDAGHREHLRVRVLRRGAAGVLQRRAQVRAAGEHEHRHVRAEVGDGSGPRRRRPVRAQRRRRSARARSPALNGAKASLALGDERRHRVRARGDRRVRRPRQPALDAGRRQQAGGVDVAARRRRSTASSAPRCSSGAASPSASEAIAAGRPARSAGRQVAGGDAPRRAPPRVTRAVVTLAGRRDQRPAQRALLQPLGGCGQRGVGIADGRAGRARGSRPRAAPAACRAAQLVDAVEAVDRRRGVQHQRRGRGRVAARVLARHLRAVGDAEQRELVDAERDAQVLEVLRGLRRVQNARLSPSLAAHARDVAGAARPCSPPRPTRPSRAGRP